MTISDSLILSIVEGLTEFLPISSTAHMVLASQILQISQTPFVKSFEIIIQLGAILAVIFLYFKELIKSISLWPKIILAFLPSTIIGLLFYDFVKEKLIGNGFVTAIALIVGGLIFIVLDRLITRNSLETSKTAEQMNNPRIFIPGKSHTSPHTVASLSPVKLIIIGLFQCIAMVPGVSRAAATIFGGLIAGLNKEEATKFSFFLAIPTMLAATTLDIYKSGAGFTNSELLLLGIGLVTSFFTALAAIKFFISFVQRHSFIPFGIYRIIIGIVWIFAILKI